MRMRSRMVAVTLAAPAILAISIISAPAVSAQAAAGPRLGPSNGPPAASWLNRSLLPVDGQVAQSHWQRGAIIGGAIGTAIGVLFYNAFEYETHGGLYVVGWAFAGAMIGGLIGSGSHKT
jgi:hypothetical protein